MIALDTKISHRRNSWEVITLDKLEIEKLKTETLMLRFNPNHDNKGRFAPKGGSGGGGVAISNKDRQYGVTDVKDAIDEINSGKSNSLENNLDSDGKLTAEREQVHKDIIDGELKGKVPVEGQATMTMLGGGPASGKSSVMSTKNLDSHTVVVDPDEMKKKLPGYKKMSKETDQAASYYHEESSALAKRFSETAYSENVNVIYDGTGDGSIKSVEKKINAAKEKGYKVEAKYVTIDTDEAVKRNQKRYDDAVAAGENPRLVPESYVRSCHAKVTDISVATAPKFDHIEVWDNSGPKGSQVKIAEGGSGRYLKAVKGREADFDRYLSKGTKGIDGFVKLPDGQVIPVDQLNK